MKGEDFAIWRKGRDLSQDDVAERLGVSRRAVVAWERNETPISQMGEMGAWCIEARDSIIQQLDMLRSGKMSTGSKELIGDRVVDRDTTHETIERLERQVAEIDSIVARAIGAAIGRTNMSCSVCKEGLVHLSLLANEYAICPNCWAVGDFHRVSRSAGLLTGVRISDALKRQITAMLPTLG